MRAFRLLVALMLVAGLGYAVPTASAADLATEVPVEVVSPGTSDQAEEPLEKCEGLAPAEFACTKSWTLTGNFTFVISMSHDYLGWVHIHGWTPTGFVTVSCPWYKLSCDVVRGGVFIEGQQFTMVVKATGAGYWRVAVR